MLCMPNWHHTLAASTFIEFVLERTSRRLSGDPA